MLYLDTQLMLKARGRLVELLKKRLARIFPVLKYARIITRELLQYHLSPCNKHTRDAVVVNTAFSGFG